MLVNDLCLKGRGIVPGWLTGKLSDFAFLIVAPVVCAALLPRRLPQRRAIALCSVTVVYAAAEVSRDFSDALLPAAAAVGLRWKLWPDLTDLCMTFLNREVVSRIYTLAQMCRAHALPPRHFPAQRRAPGSCNAGTCIAACPDGVRTRSCPLACEEAQRDFSTFCAAGGTCLNERRAVCTCRGETLECGEAPPTSICETPCSVRSRGASGAAGSSP
jgi:hypothetical protein